MVAALIAESRALHLPSANSAAHTGSRDTRREAARNAAPTRPARTTADESPGRACPWCGASRPYTLRNRPVFRCRKCKRDFTATSGTKLAWRKKPMAFYEAAEVFFATNHSRGAVLAFSRQTGCAYKTAWLLFKSLGYRVRHAARASGAASRTARPLPNTAAETARTDDGGEPT